MTDSLSCDDSSTLQPIHLLDFTATQPDDAFDRMDKDMDLGWQLGQKWVPHPDRKQRCQAVAGKLLAALESDNENLALMLGGYILSRMPEGWGRAPPYP